MGDILDLGYRTFKCPWKEHDIRCWISLGYNADKARTPIHNQCGPALQSSTPAPPIPPPLFIWYPRSRNSCEAARGSIPKSFGPAKDCLMHQMRIYCCSPGLSLWLGWGGQILCI